MIMPFGAKPSSKNTIVVRLSEHPAQSAKQIHQWMQEQGNRFSYQATHKALSELLEEQIVERKGNLYSLRQEWVDQLARIGSERKKIVPNAECTVLAFDTAIEAGLFALHEISSLPNPEKKPTIALYHSVWPTVCLAQKDFEKFREVTASRFYFSSYTDTPLDQISIQTYQKCGAVFLGKIQRQKASDLYVFGDYVSEIYFDPSLYENWQKVLTETRELGGEKLAELFAVSFLQKGNNYITTIKSPALAEKIRKDLLSKFRG